MADFAIIMIKEVHMLPDCTMIKKLYEQGLSQAEIAKAYSVSKQAVSQAMRKCGIRARVPLMGDLKKFLRVVLTYHNVSGDHLAKEASRLMKRIEEEDRENSRAG
jgi:predicted DNA-binding protein YlxM (UPF0122 family)